MLNRLYSAIRERVDALAMQRLVTLIRDADRGPGISAQLRDLLSDLASEGPAPSMVDAAVPLLRSAWDRETGAVYRSPELRKAIVDQFHRLYYHEDQRTWRNTHYRGVPTLKCPLDLWIYQEILSEVRPDVVVESGTYYGGSALFLADVCQALGSGQVITIDIDAKAEGVNHSRLTKISGSSSDSAVRDLVRAQTGGGASVLVILDSDHSYAHVTEELRLWSDEVTIGSYLIVEDGNINGHPAKPLFGPGPWEALRDFVAADNRFVVDEGKEKFMMSFNPDGYLLRRA
jgi:cephalosporin hydroxylase